MPAASSRAPRSIASHAWWILLLLALALFWAATVRRVERVEALTDRPTWTVDEPGRDAASPTGFAQGQRRLIVPGHHNPSFWWIMEAQLTAEEGRLRLRHIDYDAVPDGRATRRTAPYRWWLIAVGWLQSLISGEPLGYSIERGALAADPLLFALLLVLGAAYSARYIGPLAAAGFVVGGISLFPLAANFQPGAPDPRSLAWVLALASVLPLLASWRLGGDGARRRFHFALAGIFGGLGFWNDATSQAPVLIALALGGAGWEFVRSRGNSERSAMRSLPWRAWAWAGAATTLAASVFEFAPDHFSWSLDAVSPIHALAWWGVGEALHAVGAWSRAGRAAFGRRAMIALALAGIAIAAWPAVGLLAAGTGAAGLLLAPDFYALELANHPRGGIAASLQVWLGRTGDAGAFWATLLPAGVLLLSIAAVVTRKLDREQRARLVFLQLAALVPLVLAFMQLRWWNLFDVFALGLLTGLFAAAESGGWGDRLRGAGAAVLVLPGLLVGFPWASAAAPTERTGPLEAQALIARDFAYSLVRRAGAEPVVLFSSPVFSTAAAYYGGFRVIVSNDEENELGRTAAVRFASASTEQEKSVLLHSRGVTHVALPLWDPMMDQFVRIGLNLPADQPLPEYALAVGLREWDFPPWMRPIDCLIPSEPEFRGFELRAFALQPEQEVDLALSRLADFFLQRGQIGEAQAVTASLKVFTRSVPALGAIANVQLALRDGAGLEDTLETLTPHLSRRSARNLPADRRISLAALFVQTRRSELAREQLAAAFEMLDAKTIRTLTPGTLVNLVALSRSLDVAFPDRALESLAIELIPPAARSQLPRR